MFPCSGKTELFFSGRGHKKNDAAARALCASCHAVEECAQKAADNGEEYGIWAGLKLSIPSERAKLPPPREPSVPDFSAGAGADASAGDGRVFFIKLRER